MKKIDIIMGVRPDFIRVSTLVKHFEDYQDSLDVRLIHTGQHYDKKMSGDFFEQLGIPQPDINLEVGSSVTTIKHS